MPAERTGAVRNREPAEIGRMLPRAVVVSTAASQPRYHRRVDVLIEAGFKVTVYTFRRGYYEVNRYPDSAEVIDLGPLADGRYARRVPRLLVAVARIRRYERQRGVSPSLAYAFGLDAALVAIGAVPRTCVLIHEIGDLRNADAGDSIRGRLVRGLERYVLHRSDLFVTTSEGFVSDYFARLDETVPARTLVLENKIPPTVSSDFPRPSLPREAVRQPIRIGFVGNLRYRSTLEPLLVAASRRPELVRVTLHGDGPLRELVGWYADSFKNIEYRGAFQNPRDLPEIYDGIDLNWVVYDHRQTNVRLAIPNKLYESIYFGVPLVVASDTLLAGKLRQWGVGFVVDPSRDGFAAEFLDRLESSTILSAGEKCLEVPTEDLLTESGGFIHELQRASSAAEHKNGARS